MFECFGAQAMRRTDPFQQMIPFELRQVFDTPDLFIEGIVFLAAD